MKRPAPAKNGTKAPQSRPGAWRLLFNNRLAAMGLVMVAFTVAVALTSPLLPLADPDEVNLAARLKAPFSPGHLLGTDQLGRDMLSRLIWGSRVSLAVGLVATAIAALFGSVLGILAGFYGRWLDNLLMRSVDMLMAFPYMLLALAIVAVLGPGLMNALFAISIVNIPFFARNVRGVTLSLARREYIDAARLSGQSDFSILGSEVLPNVMPVIVITISTTVGWMILETAGLSFLGLGAQPPQADLGSMLGDGRKLILNAPHVAAIPGLVILFLVVGINLLGDGMRDVLDPRLKSGVMTRSGAATEVEPGLINREQTGSHDESVPLSVSGLSTSFLVGNEVYRAVNQVDFSLAAGECLGIVGESGSGKSVTALSLLGLVPTPPGRIVGGEVVYRGSNLVGADLQALKGLRGNRIAYIFQDPLTTLNPLFKIGDQIAEAVYTHQKVSRQDALTKAVQLMEKVHIPDASGRAKAYPHQLSGGMRQRIGIAMALANDPEIIIADEPTTALDVTIQAQILKLLDDLRKDTGAALIFITHDFGVVSQVCDRVIVMYAGQVMESGGVDQVLNDPRHPYTQGLMACVPMLGRAEAEIRAIPGLAPGVNNLPPGCSFAARCGQAVEQCRKQPVDTFELGGGRTVRCLLARGAAA